MKQKRKVKSLLPNENDGNKSLLTSVLLVLGLTLCLGSASLMTTSVGAAGLTNQGTLSYTGLDDKAMNIYRLEFSNPGDVSSVESEMYLDSDSTFHVSPKPLIIVSNDGNNEVANGVYGNILGGKNNRVESNNVTVIAGEGVKVSVGNDNASVLLGKQNHKYDAAANNGAPMVVVGGDKIEVGSNHDGVVVVGGYDNKIGSNVSNGVILGGEANKVLKNSGIVGGKKVELDVENAFAFSDGADGTFKPKTRNAFYLNLDSGVGIGLNPLKKGLSVGGVISLNEVDISNNCNTVNYGLIGSYQGCLVGCTKGSEGGKWELLDRGKKCEQICRDNSSKCYFKEEEAEIPAPDYTSFCTAKTVNRAHMCNNVTNLYKNVVFESKLIDSETPCPAEHDKCIFQCNSGSHIFYDNNGKPSCKLDCVLPWSESGEKIKHDEEVEISYNSQVVTCADDAGNNVTDSCVNHKKSLKCNDGTLYLKGTNTKAVNGTNGYMYDSCSLKNYSCDTVKYNLTRDSIIDSISMWNDTDRSTTTGTRGIYKLCKDYTSNGYDVCTPTTKHYQLIKCQNGYSTGATHPYECKKKCSFDGSIYDHGQEILGYKATSATCPNVCESTTLTCDDGTWVGDATTYNRKSCSISVPSCPSSYDVESVVAMQHRDHSIYNDGCQVYTNNGNKHCVRGDLLYDLIGCDEGYHTENNQYCIPNTDNVACTQSGAPENAYYNSEIVEITWQGSWNNGYWSTAANCTWYCGIGTHLENGACVSNSKSVACNTVGVSKPSNASWVTPVIIFWQGTWDNGYWPSAGDCGYTCDSGVWPTCEEEEEEEEEQGTECPETATFGNYCCESTTCVDSEGDGNAPHRYCETATNTCRELGCTTGDPLESSCTRANGAAGICTNGECKAGCTSDDDCKGNRKCNSKHDCVD